jgi:tetratricopeptide (TPR) repeat protein
MPVSLTEKDMYPPELLAKKLNNRASFLISTGKYQEGIELLTRALELNDRILSSSSSDSSNDNKTPCSCKFCSLEACLSTTEQDQDSATCLTTMMDHDHEKQEQGHHVKNKTYTNKNINTNSRQNNYINHDHTDQSEENPTHRPRSINATDPHPQELESCRQETKDSDTYDDKFFVYRQPLLVNKYCIEENHFMGITLFLIVVFNLALAHHLMAIGGKLTKTDGECSPRVADSKTVLEVHQKALQLYDLAYQLHQDYTQQLLNTNTNEEYNRAVGSLKFTMIVSSNVGEIYRVAGNQIEYKKCLDNLLSLMMYLVESDLVILNSTEMDGFYRNISPIMLDDICAHPA